MTEEDQSSSGMKVLKDLNLLEINKQTDSKILNINYDDKFDLFG
jgi:hypothetical protein